MTVDALIFWIFVAAWAVVLGSFAFVVIPRAVGEIRKILEHVEQLVAGSSLPLQLAKAEADAARIEVALASLPRLETRMRVALATVRATPVVPPTVQALFTRLRLDVAAFRRAVR